MNQYYTPAQIQLQDYYVGRPIGMIAEIAGNQQKAYDKGLADIDAVDDIFKVDAHESESRVARDLVNQYRTKLSDIQDQFIKTGDPRIAIQAKKLAQQFASDPYKITLEQNKKGYLEEEKRQTELSAKDKGWLGYNFLNDVYKKNRKMTSLDEISPFNPTGDFRYYRQKQDIPTAADNIMKGIAKDNGEFRNLVSEVNGELTWKKHGYKDRVTLNKVIDVAQHSTENFLNSDAGKFFIDEYYNTAIQDYNKLPDNYKKEVRQAATRMLANAAYKQIGGGVTDEDYKQFDNVLRKRGFAKQDAAALNGTADLVDAETATNKTNNEEYEKVSSTLQRFKDMYHKAKNPEGTGFIDFVKNQFRTGTFSAEDRQYLAGLYKQYSSTASSLAKGNNTNKKEALDLLKSINNPDGSINYVALMEKHQELLQNSNATYNKHIKFNAAQQGAFDFMLNDLPNRNVFDSETGKAVNLAGIFTDVDKNDFKITGLEGPNSQHAGYLQLIDTKSNKKYLLQPNNEVELGATKAMQALNKAVANPKIFGTLGDESLLKGADIISDETAKSLGKSLGLKNKDGVRFRPIKYTDGKEIKIKYLPETLGRDGKTWFPMTSTQIQSFREVTNDNFSNINSILNYLKDKVSKEGTIGNYNNTKLVKLMNQSDETDYEVDPMEDYDY